MDIVMLNNSNKLIKSAPAFEGADFIKNSTKDNIESSEKDDILSSDEYKKLNKLNKKSLVDMCKDKNIKSLSSKLELIERLIRNNHSFEETETRGGQNKEKIMLTVNTFKKFCMTANSSKSHEIHDYYIKLEVLLQETINEESNELRMQLLNKEEEKNRIQEEKIKLEEENNTLKKRYVKKEREIFDKKYVLYLMTTNEGERVGEYIVGKAIDLSNRKEDYNNNKLHDFKVVYYISCAGPKIMDSLEALILSKLGKYRFKVKRDAFKLPDINDISTFTKIFDTCFKFYEDVDEEDIRYAKSTRLYSLSSERKEYRKKYYNDNIEIIKENQKIFYENNKEILSALKKIYYAKNVDKISQKRKKYYEEHKDEIIKINMDYYYDNKDDILEKRKKFYQNNKDCILEERKKYYKENYETKISPKRQELVTCDCSLTITQYSLNRHKKTETHTQRMENINKPIKSPLKERVKCNCGMIIAHSGFKRHLKTVRHESLLNNLKIKNDF